MKISKDHIYEWLEEVKDPEIPVLSLPDLGIIRNIEIHDIDAVTVTITPTFVGCPALEMMNSDIMEAIHRRGIRSVSVEISYQRPWTTDDISEKGKKALANFGLAPPPGSALIEDLRILEHATCPRCEGRNTEMRNLFGSTLCRSIHYCNDCRESFEQFKPV